jgi:hypothetical protein
MPSPDDTGVLQSEMAYNVTPSTSKTPHRHG